MPNPQKGNFAFVFLPADESQPIEARYGDKSGGLNDDFLSKEAKRYFYERSDKSAREAALDNATSEQRKILATQLREEIKQHSGSQHSNHMLGLDDDALINLMRATHTSATCEITALTVPTARNDYRAVSMYTADDARNQNCSYNRRATELLLSCGHVVAGSSGSDKSSLQGIYGDAFVGRCHDNEVRDIWERVDFSIEDADPKAEWCNIARMPGGGGGVGGSGGPRSLSGLMNQNSSVAANSGAGRSGGAANGHHEGRGEKGYSWLQNDDEVELRFDVPPGTKAKFVKVIFGRASLSVSVSGQILVSGELGGMIVIDGSTFTIEDANTGPGKELCVTLEKKESYTWPFIVR